MTDLADALLIGTRSAPQLDPSMIYGVAASSSLDDVADNAQGTQAFGAILKRKSYLEAQETKVQAAAWSNADPSERQMLTASGYHPPNLETHGRSLFGQVAHAAGSTIGAGMHVAEKAIGVPVEEALHAAGAGLRNLQHLYRSAALITDDNVLAGRGQMSLHGTFSPSEWARMWRESEHGEQTFSPVAVRGFSGQYDQGTLDLARQIASGVDPTKIVLAAPETDRQALAQRIQGDTELHDAVRHFQSAKISVGRRVVGDSYIYSHPLAGKLASGGIDAVADWYGDPLVIGTKYLKGAEVARYLVRGPEDVDRLAGNANVQRALRDVTDTLNSGGAGALVERWPKLARVAPQLVQEGVDSPEKLQEWFKGQAGLASILDGRATGTFKSMPQMLKLNPWERAGLEVKGGLKKVIDWAADSPARIAATTGDEQAANGIRDFAAKRVGGAGTMMRRLTTLTARTKGMAFDPTSDEALTVVQRLAGYALPADRTREVVNAWSLAPDLATKRNIYKGLIAELGDASGVTATEEGRSWLTNFVSNIDEAISRPVYSGSGADVVTRDGIEARRGLLENHLTTEWALPDFKTFWAQSKRVNFLGRIYQGTVGRDGIDRFMQVWKPAQLLRLGFPIRAGGEELVGAIMREGPVGLIRGRLASGVLESQLAAEDRLLPFHPLHSIYERLTGHLPEQIKNIIDTPADFTGAVVGDRARRAFRGVEEKLAGQRYMDAAHRLYDNGALDDAFARQVSAAESRAAGYLDDDPSVIKIAKDGGKARPAELRGTGEFRNYLPQENGFTLRWQMNLDEAKSSQLGRAALGSLDKPHEEQIRAVQDVIEGDGFARMRARSDRSLFTTDGRIVGSPEAVIQARRQADLEHALQTAKDIGNPEIVGIAQRHLDEFAARAARRGAVDVVEATPEQANRDWAEAVVQHVNSLIRDPEGNVLTDITEPLLAGKTPRITDLNAVAHDIRPESMKGEEMLPVSTNWFRDLMDKGFYHVVGRPMDWMVRQPLFVHNYEKAYEDAQGFRRVLGDVKDADRIIHDVAVEGAINRTVPFVHDPQLRSQFSIVTRNLSPFWFAQEQFYKRWSRVLQHSPEAFRQAQLVMMGLRHSGVLHRNADGQDYFMYPGAAVVQHAISKGFEMVTGQKVTLPAPVGFSGQVRFATPGLERLGVPSFGPVVGIPMRALASRFPELDETEQALLGERGAGRSYWEQITPTTLSRFIHVATDNPDTSPQMASAMMQAMAYLEANGQAPANDASPVEREAYIERVKNWTRSLMLARMVFGYAAPAAPEVQLDPDHLHQEYRDLLGTLPIEQAQQEFMRRHPDATAYTVFGSKSAAGAPLPATTETLAFLNKHADFLQTFPQASGWLMPQQPSDASFSMPAYREQLALELRTRKSPEQWYTDVKFAEGADQYFRSRDAKDAALTAAVKSGNSTKATSIRTAWDSWKTSYFTSHPVFAERLQAPDAQIRRAQTIDQLHQALADPRLPKSAESDAAGTLVRGWDELQANLAPIVGSRTARAGRQRKFMQTAFLNWANGYVADHPEAKGLFDSTFRPELQGVD